MTAYFLFYDEVTIYGEKHYPWLDRWQGMYGFTPVIIRRTDSQFPGMKSFDTIEEALNDPDLKDLSWVWLDATGEQRLDEFDHLEDNVVYCVGSDDDGFDGRTSDQLPGTKIKLCQPTGQEGEWYAAMVIPMVVYDRFLKLSGRRL